MYGLTVRGLDDVVELDADVVGDDRITVQVTRDVGPHVPPHPLDADRLAEPVGPSHQWVLDRAAGTAHLVGPPLDPDLVAHPCLAPAAIALTML